MPAQPPLHVARGGLTVAPSRRAHVLGSGAMGLEATCEVRVAINQSTSASAVAAADRRSHVRLA